MMILRINCIIKWWWKINVKIKRCIITKPTSKIVLMNNNKAYNNTANMSSYNKQWPVKRNMFNELIKHQKWYSDGINVMAVSYTHLDVYKRQQQIQAK